MRHFCFLLIAFFVLSSTVNAATFCCGQKPQKVIAPNSELASMMDCHKKVTPNEVHNAAQNEVQTIDTALENSSDQHDCSCKACVQHGYINNTTNNVDIPSTSAQFQYPSYSKSNHSSSIDYPPKPLS